MSKPRTYHYFVANQLKYGGFPTDMLRYDQARVLLHGLVAGRPGFLIEGKTKPTVGRWSSFLFTVMPATHGEDGWQVKMGSMWETLKETTDEDLPVYLPN